MRTVVAVALTLVVCNLLLIAVAVLTGSLLRLVFPSVDRGMSILIGLGASVSSSYFIIKAFALAERDSERKAISERRVVDDYELAADEERASDALIRQISIVDPGVRSTKTAKRRK